MNFRFYLDALEIEEPIGWDDFELSMNRDPVAHGMQFEASTGSLEFYGEGADYLRTQKETNGISANVIFKAQEQCDSVYYEEFSGRVNFEKYKDQCGTTCKVTVPIEEASCKVVFKSNYDKKVNVDSLTSLDATTALPNYNNLGTEITLKAKALEAKLEGFVQIGNDGQFDNQPAGGTKISYIRPNYSDVKFSSIATDQLTAINNSNYPDPITPQLLFEDSTNCFHDVYAYSARMKGQYFGSTVASGTLTDLRAQLLIWDGNGTLNANATVIEEHVIATNVPFTIFPTDFDISFSGTIATLPQGIGLYNVLKFTTSTTTGGTGDVIVGASFHPETHFLVSTKKLCPDTQVKSYMIHECLSRVCESITNGCIRVKSPYYGRMDSQPFAFSEDGCGSLRMLTSGLKIRRATDDNFFTSIKDLYEGLRCIDNVGFAIEPDPDRTDGGMWMRIEEAEKFYTDDEILVLDSIPLVSNEVQGDMHYSLINVGYKKWQIEDKLGLDEFNSTREYVTAVNTINNTLDLTSVLITGSYIIETCRQQSFADSGSADTKFDNDVFLICMKRSAYAFIVEQGGIDSAANVYDPDTVYNYRLSPVRNLMRWFKSIINTYPTYTGNKLYFSAGTGNLVVTGEVNSGCIIENQVLTEQVDLVHTMFADHNKAIPSWKNDAAIFDYPLTLAQYNKLKSNPYGYISYQCGNGDFVKAYISEIKFKPAKGIANFNLIKKY